MTVFLGSWGSLQWLQHRLVELKPRGSDAIGFRGGMH